MIFRHSVKILCWILIVNSTVKNVRAISFDDIFEYFLDAVDDSDELSDELANSNLNVTCKNCNVSVMCDNCTHSHSDTQSTLPLRTSTQNNQRTTPTSPLPTPTIPTPDQVSAYITSEIITTATQSASTTATTPLPNATTTNSSPEDASTQAASTRPIDNGDRVTDDGTSVTTSADSSTSDDVVTAETDPTTESI